MNAPHKLPRFQAANDVPKRRISLRLPKITLARNPKFLKRLAIGGVLLLTSALTVMMVIAAQKPSAPVALASVTPPPQPAKPVQPAEPAKLTDIILPASSLSPEAPLPEEQAINIVAGKIGDLPALNGKGVIQIAPAEAEDNHTLLIRAREMLTSGNYGEALGLYDQVLASDPHNHDALSGKIFALGSTSANEEAIEVGHRLLKLYPHDALAAANLAHLLTQSGRNDEAIVALDRAVRGAPDNLSIRLALAGLYNRAGNHAEALMLYRQVADASEREENIDLPLAGIRQRIDYLERLEADSASDPSTTLPVDN